MGRGRRARHRDPVHPGPRDHAGLHRRPVHRRPRHDARGDGRPRRRPDQDQPAVSGRAGHRPLRHHRRVRPRRRVRAQRRARVRAQPRALPVPALGSDRLRRLQGRAPGHRHRPPGQHRAPGPHRHGPRRRGLPRHLRRHRLAHDDGQRPRRPRLGRRRHRGRGGDARPAGVDAHPARGRVPAHRLDPGRGDRHRRGAHHHRDAAQARRGRQVRRVLRRRRRPGPAGQPRHDRQHEPRVRLDLRHLPHRRRHPRLPAPHRPVRRAGGARRGVRQGAGPLARPERRAAVLRAARARPVHRRPVDRRPEASAGPHRAHRREEGLPQGPAHLRQARRGRPRDGGELPGQRPHPAGQPGRHQRRYPAAERRQR